MRSTGETDLRRAKVKCEAFVRIAEEESRGTVDRGILERIVDDALARLGHSPPKTPPTAREWLEKWLDGERGAVATGTYEKYAGVIRGFLSSLGRSVALAQVTETDILKFRDRLFAEGRTAQTVNQLVRVILKRAFRVAVESGEIQRNPVALVRALRGTRATKGTFTPEQIAKLLAASTGDWHGIILAGYYTGSRLGDLKGLKWESVSPDMGTITFTQGKTDQFIVIPCHAELKQWLESQLRTGNVFPTLATKRIPHLSREFTRLLEQAEIETGEIRKRKGPHGKKVAALSFHSLRHSFTSHLANAGVPSEIRQMLTGHRDSKSHAIYSHHELAALRAAIEKLPKL
jgi:integrase